MMYWFGADDESEGSFDGELEENSDDDYYDSDDCGSYDSYEKDYLYYGNPERRNDQKFEKLKSLREKVNWEVEEERVKFFHQLCELFSHWTGELPNLQDFFADEEIFWLLTKAATDESEETRKYLRERFMKFVAHTGYKDYPDVGEDGKPKLNRTTPLHHVSRSKDTFGKKSLVRQLFKIYDRFNVNYIDEFEFTHFHVACKYGIRSIVTKFLELGVDLDNLAPTSADPPLNLALEHGRKRVAELLLYSGADPNSADKNGKTPLQVICERDGDDVKLADKFFRLAGGLWQTVEVNAQDKFGNTPLHVAASDSDKARLFRFLLRNDANPNLVNAEGSTPLHIICRRNRDSDLAIMLFDYQNDEYGPIQVDARDNLGRTPLQLAVANFKAHLVEFCLDHGAELSNFVFPTESHFTQSLKWIDDRRSIQLVGGTFYFRLVSAALAGIEHLVEKGYEMDRSNCMTIMKMFAKLRLLEKSVDPVQRLPNTEEFACQGKKVMITSDLSIYDLVQLRIEDVEKLVTVKDYYKIGHSYDLYLLPNSHREACAEYLSEAMSRGFCRRWALDPLWELTGKRLPILCCELVIERLMCEDLCRICLATTKQISTSDNTSDNEILSEANK